MKGAGLHSTQCIVLYLPRSFQVKLFQWSFRFPLKYIPHPSWPLPFRLDKISGKGRVWIVIARASPGGAHKKERKGREDQGELLSDMMKQVHPLSRPRTHTTTWHATTLHSYPLPHTVAPHSFFFWQCHGQYSSAHRIWGLPKTVVPTTQPSFPRGSVYVSLCFIKRLRSRCFLKVGLRSTHPRNISPATHCNTLQCTATHCNTLHHTATHCNTQCVRFWLSLSGSRECNRPEPPGSTVGFREIETGT